MEYIRRNSSDRPWVPPLTKKSSRRVKHKTNATMAEMKATKGRGKLEAGNRVRVTLFDGSKVFGTIKGTYTDWHVWIDVAIDGGATMRLDSARVSKSGVRQT